MVGGYSGNCDEALRENNRFGVGNIGEGKDMIRWYWVVIVFLTAMCVSFFVPYSTMTLFDTAIAMSVSGVGIGFGITILERFVEGDGN